MIDQTTGLGPFLNDLRQKVIEVCSALGLDESYLTYAHSLDSGTLRIRVSTEYFDHESRVHVGDMTEGQAACIVGTLIGVIGTELDLRGVGIPEPEAA